MATHINTTTSDTLVAGIGPAAAGVIVLILCIITIIGNTLLISSIWKLRRTNHNLHPVLVTLVIYSCFELSFAIIPECIFSVSFLSKKWELETSQGLCNFTGWYAFTTKSTCAFITAILIFERYAVICKPNSTKLGRMTQSQVYWAFRVIFLAGVMATVPLFYGSGLTATNGSLCHINYASETSASFGYIVFLCASAYFILFLVLFYLISILCKITNDKRQQDPEDFQIPKESPISSLQDTNKRYYTIPVNKRSGTPLSPSKYALDDKSYFETMQNDVRRENRHITRITLVLTFWYWICSLPYLIVMTLALANFTISGTTDFIVSILIIVNGAMSPYIVIALYPPCQRQIHVLLRQNKRKEPSRNSIVGSPDYLPHSLSVVYDGMSPIVESMNARASVSSSTWQPNDSFCTESTVVQADGHTSANSNHQQTFHTEGSHDPAQTDDKQLLQGNQKQMTNNNGESQDQPLFYDNVGFMADDNNRRPKPDEEFSQSDETGTSYTVEDGESSESECSACDMIDEYPRVVFLDKLDHYYYPSRMPLYSNNYDTMSQLIYQQDPENPNILYALTPPPMHLSPSRILGRAELRKMAKKGKAPPSYFTRDDIPCETSLYSHNYRAPSFLKQYQGKAGWKENFEMEKRAFSDAPASEGDVGSSSGAIDDFDIERRNTWNGARFRSRQTETLVRSGVDRQSSYRLAVGDDDFLDTSPELYASDPSHQGDMQQTSVVEKDVVLRDMKMESPLALNMAFQRAILQDSGGNSSQSISSKTSTNTRPKNGTPEVKSHPHNESVDRKFNLDHASSANFPSQDSPTLPSSGEQSAGYDLQAQNSLLIIEDQYSKRDATTESILGCNEILQEPDTISLASMKSDVSYRQYVRTITAVPPRQNISNIPTIEVTPPKSNQQFVDTDSDSDHSVESLLHMFSKGIGRLAVPSVQKAKEAVVLKTLDASNEGSTKNEQELDMETSCMHVYDDKDHSHGEISSPEKDSDHTVFHSGEDCLPDDDGDAFGDLNFETDFGFAEDLTAEFDRKLNRRLAANSLGSQTSDEDDSNSTTSTDQIIAAQIRMIVENIVEEEKISLVLNTQSAEYNKDANFKAEIAQENQTVDDASLCDYLSDAPQHKESKTSNTTWNVSISTDIAQECHDEIVDGLKWQVNETKSLNKSDIIIDYTDGNNPNNTRISDEIISIVNNNKEIDDPLHSYVYGTPELTVIGPDTENALTVQISDPTSNQASIKQRRNEVTKVYDNELHENETDDYKNSVILDEIANVELSEVSKIAVDDNQLSPSSVLVDDVFESDQEDKPNKIKDDTFDITYVVRYNMPKKIRTSSVSSTNDSISLQPVNASQPEPCENTKEPPLNHLLPNEQLPEKDKHQTRFRDDFGDATTPLQSDTINVPPQMSNGDERLFTTNSPDYNRSPSHLLDEATEQVSFPSFDNKDLVTSSSSSSKPIADNQVSSLRDDTERQQHSMESEEMSLHLPLSESFKQQPPPPSPYADSPLPPPSPYGDNWLRPEQSTLKNNNIKTRVSHLLPDDYSTEKHESNDKEIHEENLQTILADDVKNSIKCSAHNAAKIPSNRIISQANVISEGGGLNIKDSNSARDEHNSKDYVHFESPTKTNADKKITLKQKSPKRSLWKRYKNVILKMSNEDDCDNNTMVENGIHGECDGANQERCTDLKITESMRQMITNIGENKADDATDPESVVVPGVAPRRQNPRTLWKKYRRDIVNLSQEIKSGGKNNIDLKNSQTTASLEPKQDHHSGQSYVASDKEIRTESTENSDLKLALDLPKFMRHESSSIADTPKENKLEHDMDIRLEHLGGVELPTFLRHESSSIAETPKVHKHPLYTEQRVSDVDNSEDQESLYVHNDKGPQTETNEIDIWKAIERRPSDNETLNKERPEDHQLFQKLIESSLDEEVVILKPNSMTSVPMRTNIPSPDGSPTHINVVNMLMINVNDRDEHHTTVISVNDESANVVNDENSRESSFSSSDLSSLSKYSDHFSSDIENNTKKLHEKSDRRPQSLRRHSTGTSLPSNECDNLEMSICSGGPEDLSVCSGELNESNTTKILIDKSRRRCSSASGCAVLERQGSFLDHSELI